VRLFFGLVVFVAGILFLGRVPKGLESPGNQSEYDDWQDKVEPKHEGISLYDGGKRER